MDRSSAAPDLPNRNSEEVFRATERFPPRGVKPQMWGRVQLRRLDRDTKTLHQARLIGYIKDDSILVTVPLNGGDRVVLAEGDPVEVRMLSGKNIYVFQTEVQRVCIAPTHYVHLTYPSAMGRQKLRQAPWARVNLVGTASGDSGASEPAYITNLSTTGAQVHLPRPIGDKGARVRLSVQVTVEELSSELALDAVVRHVRAAAANEEILEYGVAFENLRPEDALWLKALVYQRIAEGYSI